MGESCSSHGGDKKWIQNFYPEDLKGRDKLEDISVDGRIFDNFKKLLFQG
jgi:hypothetical protein